MAVAGKERHSTQLRAARVLASGAAGQAAVGGGKGLDQWRAQNPSGREALRLRAEQWPAGEARVGSGPACMVASGARRASVEWAKFARGRRRRRDRRDGISDCSQRKWKYGGVSALRSGLKPPNPGDRAPNWHAV